MRIIKPVERPKEVVEVHICRKVRYLERDHRAYMEYKADTIVLTDTTLEEVTATVKEALEKKCT